MMGIIVRLFAQHAPTKLKMGFSLFIVWAKYCNNSTSALTMLKCHQKIHKLFKFRKKNIYINVHPYESQPLYKKISI